MAQYIPYNPVYIPEIQPYRPDFNFLGNIAQTKQSRYDTAYKKLGDIYGNLLNSPLSRTENIEKRDAFFKSIDQDIKKMSGMDLSLQQNQDAAMQVFKGLYEDPDIVKDMAYTKNVYNQMERGQALRLCVDPTKCDGEWWEGGDQELQYKLQEFKNASREEALAMQSPEYTAHYNVEKMAIKAAKDAGFNMKVDTVKGGYIVTDGNGVMMQPSLADFFLHQFGNDPKVMKMYNSQGYLQRKNWVASNLQNYGGDENKANLDYISKMMTISEKAKAKQTALDDKVTAVKTNKQLAEEKIKKDGYSPDIDENLGNVYSGLFLEEKVAESAAEMNRAKVETGESIAKNMSNIKFAISNIDNLVALNLLKQATNTAATHYSELTMSKEMKADPYALASYQGSISLNNSLKLAEQNFIYDTLKKKQDYEYDMKKAGAVLNALGEPIGAGAAATTDAAGNKLEANVDARGASTNAGAINARDENYGYRQSLVDANNESRKSFVNTYVKEALNTFTNLKDNKQKEWLKSSLAQVLANTGISVNDLVTKNLTPADVKKLEAMTPQQVSAAYAIASSYANPGKDGVLAGDFFTKSFYDKHGPEIAEIKRAEVQQKMWDDHFQNVAQVAIDKTKGDFLSEGNAEGKTKAEILDMFVKHTHRPFTEDEFDAFNKTDVGHKMSLLYADKHWKDYLPAEYANKNVKDVPSSLLLAAKGRAIDAYDDNAKEALVAYHESYNAMTPSYRQAKDLKGTAGNALTSIAHGGTFDPMVAGEQTTYAADYLKTYDKLQNRAGVKVAFGDAAELPEGTDADAQLVLNTIISDAKNPLKMTDKESMQGRPRFKWHAQDIAGGDPNYVSMTMYLDAGYINNEKFIGKEKAPGILAGKTERATEGITVFFPRNMVDNKYRAKFKTDPIEMQYEATGSVNIGIYDDIDLSVDRTDAGPLWKVTAKYPGKPPIVETVPLGNVDFAEAFKSLVPYLQEKHNEIAVANAEYRKQNGTTNPEDVVKK